MQRHVIGKALCLTTLSFRTTRQTYLAGVVRIGGQNKVIVAQMSRDTIVKVVAPVHRPGELDRNLAFSCWPSASLEEAKMVVSGEIRVCVGSSLGMESVRHPQT
jgi:hypothetical protein